MRGEVATHHTSVDNATTSVCTRNLRGSNVLGEVEAYERMKKGRGKQKEKKEKQQGFNLTTPFGGAITHLVCQMWTLSMDSCYFQLYLGHLLPSLNQYNPSRWRTVLIKDGLGKGSPTCSLRRPELSQHCCQRPALPGLIRLRQAVGG